MYSDAAPGPGGDGQPAALAKQPAETGEPAQPEAKFCGATAAVIIDEGLQAKLENLDLFCQSHLNYIKESEIINMAFV